MTGWVCYLGTDLSGANVWCLTERRHLFTRQGAIRETVTLGELLGGGWLTRALNSAR